MFKKMLMLTFCLCLALSALPARADGNFDFTPYELRADRFVFQAYMLDEHNIAAYCWNTPNGALNEPLFLTWWRDGEIIREYQFTWDDPGIELVPRRDGTVAVLRMSSEIGICLYDWTDEGLVNEKQLSKEWVDYTYCTDGIALLGGENGKNYHHRK